MEDNSYNLRFTPSPGGSVLSVKELSNMKGSSQSRPSSGRSIISASLFNDCDSTRSLTPIGDDHGTVTPRMVCLSPDQGAVTPALVCQSPEPPMELQDDNHNNVEAQPPYCKKAKEESIKKSRNEKGKGKNKPTQPSGSSKQMPLPKVRAALELAPETFKVDKKGNIKSQKKSKKTKGSNNNSQKPELPDVIPADQGHCNVSLQEFEMTDETENDQKPVTREGQSTHPGILSAHHLLQTHNLSGEGCSNGHNNESQLTSKNGQQTTKEEGKTKRTSILPPCNLDADDTIDSNKPLSHQRKFPKSANYSSKVGVLTKEQPGYGGSEDKEKTRVKKWKYVCFIVAVIAAVCVVVTLATLLGCLLKQSETDHQETGKFLLFLIYAP